MQNIINLKDFIDINELPYGENCPENALDLLGKKLTAWIENFLTEYDVKDEPLIKGKVHHSAVLEGRVLIEEGAIVEPGAMIKGPTIIGRGSEVRQGAYIRGSVFVGNQCIVGHVTEVKGSVFFDGAKAGHFAYVGDSILGCDVNLGAGTKLANLRLKGDTVFYIDPVTQERVSSGLRKFGGVIGDRVQTGCNSVLSPGTLLFRDTGILPCVHYHGTLQKGFAR